MGSCQGGCDDIPFSADHFRSSAEIARGSEHRHATGVAEYPPKIVDFTRVVDYRLDRFGLTIVGRSLAEEPRENLSEAIGGVLGHRPLEVGRGLVVEPSM